MSEIGEVVRYIDPVGKEHFALVTANWGDAGARARNLVYVSTDEAEADQYGRQIKRDTSVVHESAQSAPGRYWKEA